MTNTNKQGYSIGEIAQILGCTSATVRRYIELGKLKCLSHTPGTSGRVWHRVTREQLLDYLLANKDRYDKELIDKFSLPSERAKRAADTFKTEESPVNVDDRGHAAYPATNLNELQGAWADLAKAADDAKEQIKNDPNKSVIIATPIEDNHIGRSRIVGKITVKEQPVNHDAYSILIGGRICVTNVTKETAGTIVDALLKDEYCQFNELTIKKG